MSLGNEAREYVAGLTGGELDAMLDRQLSVRLRHAAEVERDKRTCRDCALVGYHCGACDCCTEDDQSDATPSAENDAVAEPLFGFPVGPWFRWFAWHPVQTTDRGWRWFRVVWRRRYQTHSYLSGPTSHWFHARVTPPGKPASPEPPRVEGSGA